MAYDLQAGCVVLFGGWSEPNTFGDTWAWDGTDWTQRTLVAAPSSRDGHAMAYDSQRARVVLFGGETTTTTFGDTWECTQPPSATFSTFGNGCAGTVGTPRLLAAAGSRPVIGAQFAMELDQLPTVVFAVPFGILGFDRTAWAGSPLPLALDSLGMIGCQAWIDPQFVVGLVNAQGRAAWTIAIPPVPAFLGSNFYVQGFVLDLGANAGNAVVSNAGDARIGV
jgi:hypothetical protein